MIPTIFKSIMSVILLGVCSAQGQESGIYVEFWSPLNPVDQWAAVPGFPNRHQTPVPQPGLASGSNITINNATVTPYRVFAVSPSTTDIGNITVNGSEVLAVLFVGRPTGTPPAPSSGGPLDAAGARNIGSITQGGIKLRVQARALEEIQGSVFAYEVVRLDAGTIKGNITHNPSADPAAPSLGWIQAVAIEPVTIRSLRGNIGNVRATSDCSAFIHADIGTVSNVIIGGDLLGDVRAITGSILNITVTGDLGASGSGGTITIEARDEVRRVIAARAWADIDVTGTTEASGILRSLTTTNGPFIGSINAELMDSIPLQQSGFTIAGDLDADFTIRRYLIADNVTVNGWLPAGRTIKLGQGWWDPRVMTFTGGLEGQVIFNSLNLSNHFWTGEVRVGPVGNQLVLSPTQPAQGPAPYYATLSSQLGGGAVGLAPFHLHDEDCTPPNGYLGLPPDDNKIRLRWYGPLSWNPASGVPVTVEYSVSTPPSWTDITGYFAFEINPTNPRELVLTPTTPWDLDYISYRVIPTPNLKCAGVTGTPAVYDRDTYIVEFDN